MIIDTNSTINIKGLKISGHPTGTKCVNNLYTDLSTIKITLDNHNTAERERVKDSLEAAVKTLAPNPIKFIRPNWIHKTGKKATNKLDDFGAFTS